MKLVNERTYQFCEYAYPFPYLAGRVNCLVINCMDLYVRHKLSLKF